MKKKTIFTLIGALALVALLFWPEISKAGAAFTFDPASGGKVGEKIKINITVTNIPADAEKLELVIFDAPPNEDQDYRKLYYNVNASQPLKYTWDTEAAESVVGPHRIVIYANKTVNGELKRGQNLGEASYTLLSASSDDTETPPDTADGSSTAFDLGRLGRVTFLPTKVNSPAELVLVIINWLIGILGSLAVIAIIYSGIMYITAGPDTARAEAAKKNLLWAIVGIVIILAAFLIVNFVINAIAD